jgi:bacterial/archaeal transporter family protein
MHILSFSEGNTHKLIIMTWITWSLLSALFAAATAILAKMGVAHVESNLATAIRTTVVLVLAWSVVLGFGSHRHLSTLDLRSTAFLIASGVATGLSWLCYFKALASGPASKVAPIDKLSVLFVIFLAWLVLGESLTRGKLLGGGLMVAGALVLALVN